MKIAPILILAAAVIFIALTWTGGSIGPVDRHPNPNDPNIVRMSNFLNGRGLKWDLTVGDSGDNYCVSAFTPSNTDTIMSHYQVECEGSLKKVADAIIADYEKNKPGYCETHSCGVASEKIAQGGGQ